MLSVILKYLFILIAASAITVGLYIGLVQLTSLKPITSQTVSPSSTPNNMQKTVETGRKDRVGDLDINVLNFPSAERPPRPVVQLTPKKPERQGTITSWPNDEPHIKISGQFPQYRLPILRHPPIMPKNASKSGFCKFSVKVNEQGVPVELIDLECTDQIFLLPTKAAVRKWRYRPEIKNGRPIPFISEPDRLTFRLLGAVDNTIAE